MTSHDPVLITTLEPVPKGTNGGITLLGEAAALGASAAIAFSAFFLGIGNTWMLLAATLAGFLGSNVDSLIGAVLENRGFIGNAGTNLLATLAGGLIALLLFSIGYYSAGVDPNHLPVPIWVILSAHAAIALGTLTGGWRIVRTMGYKITRLRPVDGFSAEIFTQKI
jgi:hypothetical protein